MPAPGEDYLSPAQDEVAATSSLHRGNLFRVNENVVSNSRVGYVTSDPKRDLLARLMLASFRKERDSAKERDRLARLFQEMRNMYFYRMVLIRWFQVANKPCPTIGMIHVDPRRHRDTLNNFMKTQMSNSFIQFLGRVLAEWHSVARQESSAREIQTQICASMIEQREHRSLSRSFYRWLRAQDDIRMGRAATRIEKDTNRLFEVQHRLDREMEHSDRIIELLNGTLNYTETRALIDRYFYLWLCRAQQRVISKLAIPNAKKIGQDLPEIRENQPSILNQYGVSIPRDSGRKERIFEAPAWPGPYDVLSKSVVSYEGKLPPMTPLHMLSDKLLGTEETNQPLTVARRTAAPPPNAKKESTPSSGSSTPPPLETGSVGRSSKSSQEPPKPVSGKSTPSVHSVEKKTVKFSHFPVEQPVMSISRQQTVQLEKEEEVSSSSSSSETSESSSESSSSSSSSESSTDSRDVFFHLSLMFFVRMRRVCRAWAQRARETVARRRMEATVNAAVERAMAAWQPAGVPDEIASRLSSAEAVKAFKEGAVVMKRKGSVKQNSIGGKKSDSWITKALGDQKRYMVGRPDNFDQFLAYYSSKDAMERGEPEGGSFSLEELKLAQFSWDKKEIGIASPPGEVKKISQIPEPFFIAIYVAIKYAIGAQVRRNSGVATVLGSRNN